MCNDFEWSAQLVERLEKTEPDSPTVYIAGACYDYGASDRVRETILERSERYDALTVRDPIAKERESDQSKMASDIDLLEECNCVLLYHVPGAESWGTPAEIYLAAMADYPVILWETENSIPRLSDWLESAIVAKSTFLSDALGYCLREV